MPNRLLPCTSLGETTILQIILRSMDYDRVTRLNSNASRHYGRHVWLELDYLRNGNAVADLIAVTENFTSKRLLQLHPTLKEVEVFTWAKRRNAWNKHAQTDLTKCGCWDKLQGFIEVRNAFQHGLGKLTDFQLDKIRRQQVLASIKAAGIHLSGDVIHLDNIAVANCRDACEQFVLELDNVAPKS